MAGAAAAVLLGVVSTIGLAAVSGGFGGPASPQVPPSGARCTAPVLAGAVVDVTLTDMGAMMGGPYAPGPMAGRWPGMGMARLFARPNTVRAGTVSLRAYNAGAWTHEVMILPLPSGQAAGQRPVGADGRVNEAGSLGEASRDCGPGTGRGITAGATGWTTVRLAAGRYELVCNLPGHYAAGMYTELDVTR